MADLSRFENFSRPETEEHDVNWDVVDFVRDHPFEHTLIEIAAEFGTGPEDVRQTLRNTGELLTAIPIQDGVRHVWGYATQAHEEWEYLRRRAGATVANVQALSHRMGWVQEKYGAARTAGQLDVAVLLLNLHLALVPSGGGGHG